MNLLHVRSEDQRKLTSALLWIFRGDNVHMLRAKFRLYDHLQVSSEPEGLGPKPLHTRFREELRAGPQRRDAEHWRVGQHERLRAVGRDELMLHLETVRLPVTPPPAEATRKVRSLHVRVTLVHKGAGDVPGPGVQVLVCAPACKVAAPVVQPQGRVADRVGQVEADDAALGFGCLRDAAHLEELAGVVLDAAEHHQGHLITLRRDGRLDVLGSQRVLTLAWPELDQGHGRVEALSRDLRHHGKLVRGEGLALDEDLVPGLRGPVEGTHEQVQVHGEGVHDDHLVRLGPHDVGQVLAAVLVGRDPRPDGVHVREVALDAPALPLLELLHHVRLRGPGLQPKAVAAEVDAGRPLLPQRCCLWRLGEVKLLPERGKLIAGVHPRHELLREQREVPGLFEAGLHLLDPLPPCRTILCRRGILCSPGAFRRVRNVSIRCSH
mmetsp:Transcript_8646/g.19745  ORF Transcript_8646/g.19745 Transcript_8646/m.19745 type:complete len:437 (+) Transcript_8646:319-1629(+)